MDKKQTKEKTSTITQEEADKIGAGFRINALKMRGKQNLI